MNFSGFEGKRALVTGGSRGIGLAIAKALHKAGAVVVITGRDKSHLEEAKKEMQSLETLCFNLSDWKATKTAVESVLPIDLLVNNAGVFFRKPFGEWQEDDFDFTFNVNVKAVVNVSQIVTNDLKSRQRPGSIVNISSVAGLKPSRNNAIYCSSKFALGGLTACMTLELGQHSIRVNSINPSIVMTDMAKREWKDPLEIERFKQATPLKRFPEVEEVATAVMFLLSQQGSYLNGVMLPIDGGRTRTT